MVAETAMYDALGITPAATEAEIKSAYRKMALKYHPDKNGGSEEAATRFKCVAEAYEILSDPQKRKLYNERGKAGLDASNAGGGGGGGGAFNAEDIFSSFFGGGRAKPGQRKPRDIVIELELTLEEVYCGSTKILRVTRMRRCTPCNGTGSADRTVSSCSGCRGAGTRAQVVNLGGMHVQQQIRCGMCGGSGKQAPRRPCETCGGAAYCREVKNIQVEIVKGTQDSDVVRLGGDGDQSPNADVDGDILIVFEVLSHPQFTRIGDDLLVKARVPLSRLLALDLCIPIEHLDRRVLRCRLRHATDLWSSNFAYVCYREGMSVKGTSNERGKLTLVVEAVMPKSLDEPQQRRIASALGYTLPRPLGAKEEGDVLTLTEWTPPLKQEPDAKETKEKKKKGQSSASPKNGRGESEDPRVHVQQCQQQ